MDVVSRFVNRHIQNICLIDFNMQTLSLDRRHVFFHVRIDNYLAKLQPKLQSTMSYKINLCLKEYQRIIIDSPCSLANLTTSPIPFKQFFDGNYNLTLEILPNLSWTVSLTTVINSSIAVFAHIFV